MHKWIRWLILGGVFLSACTAKNTSSPLPTVAPFKPIIAQLTPELNWLRPILAACSSEAAYSLRIEEGSAMNIDLPENALAFQWGGEIPAGLQGFDLGQDRLAIIVHHENPLAALTLAQLQRVYSGEITHWNELDLAASADSITLWVNSPDDQTQAVFITNLMQRAKVDAEAYLAPHPEEMRTAVSSDPLGIGFLPARWLDTSVKEINLSDLSQALTVPIVALSAQEPDSQQQLWLDCIQRALAVTEK